MPTLLTLDFETYYDREYSLSKITTEEYIRSNEYETIGVAIQIGNAPTVWYPQPDVDAALKAIDWSDKLVVCQNTAFDGAILSWRYDIKPLALFDIMGMSRALYPHEKSHSLKAQAERHGVGVKGDEVINALGKRFKDFALVDLDKYGEYCINDVELTRKLFDIYMSKGFPKQELQLIDLTLRMYTEPVLELDTPMLLAHLQDTVDRKAALVYTVKNMMPESDYKDDMKAMLMSNDIFAAALRTLNVDPPMKVSARTQKLAYAFAKTDEEFLALEDHPDVRVQALVAARLGNKTTIEETRTERFLGMATRGSFPVPLRYYGGHCGRWSGQDSINLQNLPSRGVNAGKIKKAIRAPDGYVFIDCDASQIEARTLAWMAGQTDLVQAFENKEDVYKIMASRIYNKPTSDITPSERFLGKTVILGCGYGVGHVKLRTTLKQAGVEIDEAEAKRIIDAYRTTYTRIPDLWKSAERALTSMSSGQAAQVDVPGIIFARPDQGFTLPNGLYVQYPELEKVTGEDGKANWQYKSKGLPIKLYGGKVVENVCQAVARCIIGEQMLRIAKRYKVVLTVHDAIGIVARQEEADEARAYVEACMSWRPKWAQALPLACESGMGATYGDC